MKLQAITLACACVSLTACAPLGDKPGYDYNVFVDPAFGDKVSDVIDALHEWQAGVIPDPLSFYITIGYHHCTSDDTHCIDIHPATIEDLATYYANVLHSSEDDVLGFTTRGFLDTEFSQPNDWATVSIGSDIQDDTSGVIWHKVALHEIGHALALKHTGNGSLMCARVSCSPGVITTVDVDQFNSLR